MHFLVKYKLQSCYTCSIYAWYTTIHHSAHCCIDYIVMSFPICTQNATRCSYINLVLFVNYCSQCVYSFEVHVVSHICITRRILLDKLSRNDQLQLWMYVYHYIYFLLPIYVIVFNCWFYSVQPISRIAKCCGMGTF